MVGNNNSRIFRLKIIYVNIWNPRRTKTLRTSRPRKYPRKTKTHNFWVWDITHEELHYYKMYVTKNFWVGNITNEEHEELLG